MTQTNQLTATVADFWGWNPCWETDRLEKLIDQYKDEPWTALDVLALRQVPIMDRFWVVLRPALIARETLDAFVHEVIATRADELGNTDPRVAEAIENPMAYSYACLARGRLTSHLRDSDRVPRNLGWAVLHLASGYHYNALESALSQEPPAAARAMRQLRKTLKAEVSS